MGKITVLEKNVSDKIAAGEVVERPASVVKELLENSVDAGATAICVEIKDGGIQYIRVTDDGVGMSRDDVSLSILRHATSKISTEEDLTKISTLGFRGEALSSIAAVSKLEIYTKTKEDSVGTLLSAHNGEIIDISDAGCPDGTTVVVRELFSTVPARMKFLKKNFTEAGYIEDIVSCLALSRPDISIKFINNGKEVIFTPGDNLLSSVIYAVYGKDVKNAMVDACFEERGVKVFGMCGKGIVARGNRGMENFFVNGRYIKSMLLSRAAEEAYKNELMVGKFPAFVLNLIISPEEVDINVHPTKLEAKFSDEKHVYHCIYWAVKNALYHSEFIPSVSEHKNIKPQFVSRISQPVKSFESMREVGGKTEKSPDFVKPIFTNEPPKIVRTESDTHKKEIIHKREILTNAEVDIEHVQENVNFEQTPIVKNDELVYKICGQVFSTYIIVEKDGKMLMVDQHAAHERLRYEKLLEQYRKREITSQMMLCPEIISLTATEFAVFSENRNTISELGFLIDEFGERQIIVHGLPVEIGECDVKAIVYEILGMLQENRKNIDDDLASKMLYRIACRGAVKANAILNQSEMKHLLDKIFSLAGINTCPHGRPITIEFTKEFIEKQFKRIV